MAQQLWEQDGLQGCQVIVFRLLTFGKYKLLLVVFGICYTPVNRMTYQFCVFITQQALDIIRKTLLIEIVLHFEILSKKITRVPRVFSEGASKAQTFKRIPSNFPD